MAIPVTCTCGQSLNVPDTLGGKLVRCPACKNVTRAPEPLPAQLIEDEPAEDDLDIRRDRRDHIRDDDDDDDLNVRRRERRDRHDSIRTSSGGGGKVAGGVALLILGILLIIICIGIVVATFGDGRRGTMRLASIPGIIGGTLIGKAIAMMRSS